MKVHEQHAAHIAAEDRERATVTGAKDGAPRRRASGLTRHDVVNRYGLIGVFGVIVLLFSVLKPNTFPTSENAQSIASAHAVVAMLALAAMMPLIVGHFDVSIGFQLGLSQTLCAGLVIHSGWPAGV